MTMPRDPSQSEKLTITRLSEADGRALDALLAARSSGVPMDRAPLPADSAERAGKLTQLLGVLDADTGGAVPDDLLERTLTQVRAAEQRRRFAEQVQMLSGPKRDLGVSIRQVLTAAAVFLISLSLLLPALERNRDDALRLRDQDHLRTAGSAFGSYAQDHNQQLPRGKLDPNGVWWNVGKEPGKDGSLSSNSAHLYLLVRGQYVSADELVCPSNPNAPEAGTMTAADHDWKAPAAVSYSYQNQYTDQPIRVDAMPLMAVLADKNPLIIVTPAGRMDFDKTRSTDSATPFHKGRGQNILLTDGRVIWSVVPRLELDGRAPDDHDNIWTARGVIDYDGDEKPTDPADSHLVP